MEIGSPPEPLSVFHLFLIFPASTIRGNVGFLVTSTIVYFSFIFLSYILYALISLLLVYTSTELNLFHRLIPLPQNQLWSDLVILDE